MDAKEYFHSFFKGLPNPVTPNVIEYGWVNEDMCAYELTKDDEGSLYGVTMVCQESYNRDLSKAFDTLPEARTYIDWLKRNHFHPLPS